MALKYNQKLSDLKSYDAQNGSLEWIGIRPGSREMLQTPDQILLVADYGLEGDHRAKKPGSDRQVTLFQFEYLAVIANFLGKPSIDPVLLRRNCLISGINLNSLREQRFYLGDALLEGTGYCHPCSRMEENLGLGGYNAVRGHGGITARIITGGLVKLGDPIIRHSQ